jgi:hypothetical protein
MDKTSKFLVHTILTLVIIVLMLNVYNLTGAKWIIYILKFIGATAFVLFVLFGTIFIGVFLYNLYKIIIGIFNKKNQN